MKKKIVLNRLFSKCQKTPISLTIYKRYILTALFTVLCLQNLYAQYAQHFTYDNENGLPSNEVYSIVQDKKGFIWIGCDAGLFKFDGVRYTSYKSDRQKSKSISGLTISSSGKLYSYNFQSQIFCLEKDSLKELKHTLQDVTVINLVSDTSGNLYVTHSGGISLYNEKAKTWKNFLDPLPAEILKSNKWAAKSVKGSLRKNIWFIFSKGVARIKDDNIKIVNNSTLFDHFPAGKFEIEYYDNALWTFSKEDGIIYRLADNKIEQLKNQKLNELLKGKKITNVKTLPDNSLWICTYKGIIRFNSKTNVAELYYPELSFSDCIIDRENNYWFSTLQAGILRIPNLAFKVWNASGTLNNNTILSIGGLSKITTDSTHIYFASVNGTVGKINALTGALKTFQTGNDADVQSLDYDFSENTLYFNINNRLYKLHNNTLSKTRSDIQAIKSYRKIGDTYFAASSHGLFINGKKTNNSWARALYYDVPMKTMWVATHDGLQKYRCNSNEWRLEKTLLPNTQILSVEFNKTTRQLFLLTFDGKIYQLSDDDALFQLATLPADIQGNKLKQLQNKLYIASNKGVWIYDLTAKQWNLLNALSGLASENVQDLILLNDHIWLATGKGLQQIPLDELNTEKSLAKIYLRNNDQLLSSGFQLKHHETLILNPEASMYSANGNFQYAYRINKSDWIKLPASIEQIKIQNPPTGNISIEVKAIDHLGRDSENIILLKGYVAPPFWKAWRFYLSLVIAGIIAAILISKMVIRNVRRKELTKTQLVNSQLKAIRAQMNPHFMYNTLNSIQDLILQNDIKNSNYYLSKFSQLMRQILVFSEEDNVLLSEEAEMLRNYLELEKLRFGDDFVFTLNIDENIDSSRTYIPSLIVQPYIENAVKHGLLHKKGIKKLNITFSYAEHFLEICIEDNGIGRKRSEEIKQRSGIFYNSFAGNAVQKRLELLNNTGKQKIEICISDVNEKDVNTGTRVRIMLPVNPKQPFVKN